MNQINDSINLFRNIADAISAKYIAQLQLLTAEHGTRPPFDVLMSLLKQMEKELTGNGVKFMEKHNTGNNNTELTNQLKLVIRTTIENFVHQL